MFTGFELIEVGRLDYGQLLSSQVPEVVVLAVLADFKKEPPEDAIRSIIERLQQVAKGEFSLQKYIRQLNVLSGLRKLGIRLRLDKLGWGGVRCTDTVGALVCTMYEAVQR